MLEVISKTRCAVISKPIILSSALHLKLKKLIYNYEKIIDKIKNLKINSSVFIFITIIFVSALGLQASKIYAQNSNLSRDLSVKHQAYLDGSLKVGGNLGIGTSNPAHRLSVNGVANFEGVSSGKNQKNISLMPLSPLAMLMLL